MNTKRRGSHKVPAPPKGDRRLKTIDRVLSKAGIGSRRDAVDLVREGAVTVNGEAIRNPDTWIDLDRDVVAVNGTPLQSAARAYWMLNKPPGYLTTYRHPTGRATIYDLVPAHAGWLFPVGRLDLDTSGLLLMTNDSDFSESIANPAFHVPKTYRLTADGRLGEGQLGRLRDGLMLDDGPTRPAIVTSVEKHAQWTQLDITITEGRNRQVRRMLEAVGSEVRTLRRIAIGALVLGDLEEGSMRTLLTSEVEELLIIARRGDGG